VLPEDAAYGLMRAREAVFSAEAFGAHEREGPPERDDLVFQVDRYPVGAVIGGSGEFLEAAKGCTLAAFPFIE
jgi:hypothetical protein